MSDWLIDRDMLTPQQKELLNKQQLEKCIYVTGSAGSGKSLMALYIVKRLQTTRPDANVILLVFNNVLCAFISAGMEQLGVPENSVNTAYKWYHNKRNFKQDYIIVDEAQDFCFDQSQARIAGFKSGSITEVHEQTRKGFMLFGDMQQRIYNGREWSKEDLQKLCSSCQRLQSCKPEHALDSIPKPGQVEYRFLPQNFRMPKKIAQIAAQLLSSNDGQELVRSCMNDDVSARVIAFHCKSLLDKANCIKTIIKNNGLTDVGVLVAKKEQGVNLFNTLGKQNLNCEAYLPYTSSSCPSIDFGSTNPKILTYHSAKGLQFHTVFIPFGEFEPEVTETLYVALTRAQKQVFFLYEESLCDSLNQIDTDLLPRKKWGG